MMAAVATRWLEGAGPAVFRVLFAIFGIGLGAWSVWPTDKDRAACDEAVHQLLTTKDEVELQRDIFLIRELDCSIRRRLP